MLWHDKCYNLKRDHTEIEYGEAESGRKESDRRRWTNSRRAPGAQQVKPEQDNPGHDRSGSQGDPNPSAARVAEIAGVGLRTVFRHFDDKDSIFREMNAILMEAYLPQINAPYKSDHWKNSCSSLSNAVPESMRNLRFSVFLPLSSALDPSSLGKITKALFAWSVRGSTQYCPTMSARMRIAPGLSCLLPDSTAGDCFDKTRNCRTP